MLEGARRPDEVKTSEVIGDVVHVYRPKSDQIPKLVRVAQPIRIEILEPGRMLIGRDPAELSRLSLVEVGCHNLATPRCEQRRQRLPTDGETQTATAWAEHTVLFERLGNEGEFPQLAMVFEGQPHSPHPISKRRGF